MKNKILNTLLIITLSLLSLGEYSKDFGYRDLSRLSGDWLFSLTIGILAFAGILAGLWGIAKLISWAFNSLK